MNINVKKSLDMQEKAKARIPGLGQLLSKRPDMFAFGVWPGYYAKAKGVQVWDLDGNRYIDMSIAGIGANILGYADDDVDESVKSAIDKGSSSSLNCPEEVELADLLCELHPWAQKVRYARGGGEAMTIAVRIARTFTGKEKIAFCGYHGWHDWYLAANLGLENALGEYLIDGLSPKGVPRGLSGTALPFRYNHIEDLENIVNKHRDNLAAIVMEPIRSQEPHEGFLQAVKQLAEKSQAVFIFDEVSSGFRLNTGGAHILLNATPDMAVFSKGMGNGYPIAAIIGKDKVMEAAQDTFISSTMWTERIGPTAALATIKKHKKIEAGKHLVKIGEQVQKGWQDIAKKNDLNIHVQGIKPLSHFSFQYDSALFMKALFVELMLKKGFLASNLFYAMAAHNEEHVESYLVAVDDAFHFIAKAHQGGNLKEKLSGAPAQAGFQRLT